MRFGSRDVPVNRAALYLCIFRGDLERVEKSQEFLKVTGFICVIRSGSRAITAKCRTVPQLFLTHGYCGELDLTIDV